MEKTENGGDTVCAASEVGGSGMVAAASQDLS